MRYILVLMILTMVACSTAPLSEQDAALRNLCSQRCEEKNQVVRWADESGCHCKNQREPLNHNRECL